VSDDSGWWIRPTLASDVAAESVQAGETAGTATELDGNHVPATDGTGLPVRVRQASIAPELRERGPVSETPDPASRAGNLPAASGDSSPPPAESFRSTMSAMQQGWERGRSVATDLPAAPTGADSAHDEEA
jgi:hypothetical protein